MALHMLQPSLRPMGQFDLQDGATVTGGEIGVLALADATVGTHGADTSKTSDVTAVGPVDPVAGTELKVVPHSATADQLRFLLDEGTDEYGTMLGSIVGGAAGQMTQFGGGAVVVGPATHLASGKVTCWHAPGLYGVSGTTAAANLSAVALNTALSATASTGVLTTGGETVALMVGAMYDSSLVSTTLAAADETAAVHKYAIYFLGQ